jgi:hypothetical protein
MGKHKKVNIGDRFGKLVVVKYNGVKKKKSGATVGLYLCKCDCGKHTVVETSHLTSGWTQSCGCLAGRKKLPNNQSEIRKIIVWYKRGAKRRGIEWKISNADAQEIIQKECFYCGTKFSNNCDGFKYNGIDRVDNEKGYEIGNVVPCCKACNIAKHDMKQKDFVLWARSVAEHTKSLY